MQDSQISSYLKFYDDEAYLLGEVAQTFRATGVLDPADFLTILAWKANRATGYHLRRLQRNYGAFDGAVREIAKSLSEAAGPRERLASLMGAPASFYLATATAILTILYPEEFTVYDYRVVQQLDFGKELAQRDFSDALWEKYVQFRERVRNKPPSELGLTLRDCDRYLSGKSYREDIEATCKKYSRDLLTAAPE